MIFRSFVSHSSLYIARMPTEIFQNIHFFGSGNEAADSSTLRSSCWVLCICARLLLMSAMLGLSSSSSAPALSDEVDDWGLGTKNLMSSPVLSLLLLGLMGGRGGAERWGAGGGGGELFDLDSEEEEEEGEQGASVAAGASSARGARVIL